MAIFKKHISLFYINALVTSFLIIILNFLPIEIVQLATCGGSRRIITSLFHYDSGFIRLSFSFILVIFNYYACQFYKNKFYHFFSIIISIFLIFIFYCDLYTTTVGLVKSSWGWEDYKKHMPFTQYIFYLNLCILMLLHLFNILAKLFFNKLKFDTSIKKSNEKLLKIVDSSGNFLVIIMSMYLIYYYRFKVIYAGQEFFYLFVGSIIVIWIYYLFKYISQKIYANKIVQSFSVFFPLTLLLLIIFFNLR